MIAGFYLRQYFRNDMLITVGGKEEAFGFRLNEYGFFAYSPANKARNAITWLPGGKNFSLITGTLAPITKPFPQILQLSGFTAAVKALKDNEFPSLFSHPDVSLSFLIL
jgi:hypothetical protein